MTIELFLFLFISLTAVGAAVGMLLSENAVHSALFLIVNFACVAFLYLMLDAGFLSMIQIAVYAGAIMVLFLFVIMLLGADKTTDTTRSFRNLTLFAFALAGIFMLVIGGNLFNGFTLPEPVGDTPQVRVLHAVPNLLPDDPTAASVEQTFNLYIDDEPVVTDFDYRFEDATEFIELEPGEHQFSFRVDVNDREVPSIVNGDIAATVTLEPGDTKTLVLYGTDIRDLQLAEFATDLGEISKERSARISVFNMLDDNLTLVDLGVDEELDVENVAVSDAEDADAVQVIGDQVLIENIGLNTASDAVVYGEGTYNFAFVNESLEVVLDLDEFELERDSAQLFVLAEEVFFDGTTNPTILAHADLHNKVASDFGGPTALGSLLFTDYMLPVQLVAILLLVALIGVVVLTRPEGTPQRERRGRRRKVSRPLVNVISAQTGQDVLEAPPQLPGFICTRTCW